MKSRLNKKVEKSMMAGKICELQRDICEYDRFLGDLMIMLVKKDPSRQCVEHFVPGDNYMDWIWEECRKLLLAQDLQGKPDKP